MYSKAIRIAIAKCAAAPEILKLIIHNPAIGVWTERAIYCKLFVARKGQDKQIFLI